MDHTHPDKPATHDRLHPTRRRRRIRVTGLIAAAASFAPVVSAQQAPPAPLPGDVVPIVPACALGCLASFASTNYQPSTCGSSPSLRCLCANLGLNGLTLGEAAVECIAAENRIGFCADGDATREIYPYLLLYIYLFI